MEMQMSHCDIQWCECPFGYAMMSIPLRGYAVMQMSHCDMQWCECPIVGVQWCKCPFVGISWHECFDAITIYSKIHFIFKARLPQRLKSKYFQNSIYSSQKVIFFYLRLPKKLVITVRNLRMGALTWKSDDLAQKIYFHNLVEQKGGLFPRPLS